MSVDAMPPRPLRARLLAEALGAGFLVVTVARTLSDSFAGIAPASAPGYVAAQVTGTLGAIACSRVLFAQPTEPVPVPPSPNGDVESYQQEALDA